LYKLFFIQTLFHIYIEQDHFYLMYYVASGQPSLKTKNAFLRVSREICAWSSGRSRG